MANARDWSIRAMHEAEGFENNAFVTLTFNDQNLPETGSVSRLDIKTFMKALRYQLGPGIRFMACGEYGPELGRPHYHLCLFNCAFPDLYEWDKNRVGQLWYRSPLLEKVWDKGFSTVGALTRETAGYTARYVLKKVTGDKAGAHYGKHVDAETGELSHLQPEFIQVSNRPGLGQGWIEKNYKSVYARDSIIVAGKQKPVPRYYDKWLLNHDPELYEEVKLRRYTQSLERDREDTTDRRLRDIEAVRYDRIQQHTQRIYENANTQNVHGL